MRIGDLAEKAGVTPRTIRYYESLGLLRPHDRSGAGYRHYGEAELKRLRKIDALKELGLSLDEIASVINLYFEDPSGLKGKRKVLSILESHLHESEEKIEALEQFCSELRTSIGRMRGHIAETAHRA